MFSCYCISYCLGVIYGIKEEYLLLCMGFVVSLISSAFRVCVISIRIQTVASRFETYLFVIFHICY